MGLQNRNAEPLCAALDKVETVRVDIAGIQRAAVLHLQRGGKALAARRRAAVKHAHTRLDAGNGHGQMSRRVLHIHAPLAEGSRLLHRAGDRQAARQPRMRLRTGQLLQQRSGIATQWIDLQHGLRCFVVGLQNALRLLPAELRQKQAHDGLRVAVAQAQVVRQRQRHGPQQIAQHAVDQTGRLLVGQTARLLHGLVHRRRGRDAVQEAELIGGQPQDIAHDGLQLAAHEAAQPVVEQHAVLQHAVAQPGGQRRLAAVHPAQRILQGALRPCTVAAEGDERPQRRVSCARHLRVRWGGRGNNPAQPCASRREPAAASAAQARRSRRRRSGPAS